MFCFAVLCTAITISVLSARDCPSGNRLQDIASDFDTAHAVAECSGQGICNYKTGLCECDLNFGGPSCDRLLCKNECSQHGVCISLSQAAALNDGYVYNRTTVYNLWDGKVIYGCKCDYGNNLILLKVLVLKKIFV